MRDDIKKGNADTYLNIYTMLECLYYIIQLSYTYIRINKGSV